MSSPSPAAPAGGRERVDLMLMGAAVTMLAVPSLGTLARRGLTADEGISAGRALGGVSTAALSVLYEPNLTLFYMFTWAWARLGDGEFWLRLAPLLFMLASVALCYVIASRLFGRLAGFFSAAILATNPLVLHHSQDLRPYAMLMFASLLTTLLFLRATESPSERRWAHWGIASGIAAFVHPFALFVSLAHVAIWIRQRSRAPWREVRWGAALLGASVVLLLTVMAITYDARIDWIPPLSISSLGNELRAVTGQSTGYALMAYLLVVVVSIVVNRSKRPPIETIALWFLLPLVLAILISIFKPILIARYMIIMVPPLAILLGSLVARLKFPLAVVALAILCASVAPNYLDWISGSDEGLDDAIRTIAAHSKPGDVVITQALTESALNYYMHHNPATENVPLLAPTLDAEIKQAEVDAAPRIWQAQWIGHPEPKFALPHDVVQSYSAIYGPTKLVLYVRR